MGQGCGRGGFRYRGWIIVRINRKDSKNAREAEGRTKDGGGISNLGACVAGEGIN